MRHLLTLLILLLALAGERASAFSDNSNSGTESFTWTAGGRTFDLTLHGQQESEAWTGRPLDGLAVDSGFDSLRRPNALAVTGSGGTVPSQSYSYDTLTGELNSISSGTATATYAYPDLRYSKRFSAIFGGLTRWNPYKINGRKNLDP